MLDSYYIGDWFVEPLLLKISRNGTVKKMEPQLMAVLQELSSKSGQVISKEALRKTVWVDVIITDNVLTRAISSLRKSLEDDASNPRYIETISKKGYRLIAAVKQIETPVNTENFIVKQTRKPMVMVVGILLLLILGAFATRRVAQPEFTEKIYHPNALANYSNTEYWPAISPDGKFIAYGWKGKSDDNWDVYAKLIGTETALRITENSSTDLRAKWSSDGHHLYYLRYENGGSTIYKKSVVGKEEVRILTSPEYSYGNFDVSRDEKWLSFNGRINQFSPLRLKLISLETGEEKWLTKPSQGFNGDIHPTFSKDGSKLAFIREKNSASMQLWLLDLNMENLKRITSEHESINGFDWSKEGTALIYSSNKSGLYKLWKVNLRTKQSTVLPIGDYQMVMPRIAETGRMIYAKMEDNVNIWRYDLANKTATISRANNDLNLNPVFSPNGQKICFTAKKNQAFQIWVSNVDGSKALPITNFIGEYLTSPRWSVDSKTIVFQGVLNGQTDIYKVNAQGGIPENLTNASSDDHTPFFVANNDIYFSSNRSGTWGVWKMSLDGTGTIQIIGGNAYAPQLSPDGTMIYYSKKGNFGLWNYDLKKKEEHLIIEAFHPMHWGAFAVGKKGIYYLNGKEKQFEYFDYATAVSSLIYKPQKRIPRMGITLHVSPNSQQLMFCQIDFNDADIMLVEKE